MPTKNGTSSQPIRAIRTGCSVTAATSAANDARLDPGKRR